MGLRFWVSLRASGLHDLVYTGCATVPHALLMTLCERWHAETSSFHLLVGEMTITLDDVACLMHLPIEGRMLSHAKKVSRADGVDLMVRHLCVTQAVAVNEEYGAYIKVGVTYRSLLDKVGFDDVTWRSYEGHREIQDFEEIF